jgi:hypothetical protein
MKAKKTLRGFSRIEFKDRNGIECSLQKSSIATEDCIWLGCNKANPVHMVPGAGWQPCPMPSEYVANTRMHLTRSQVKKLLTILLKFVETGEIG